jgi:uncharacterized protein YndB with AHSA1/START domain
MSTDQRAPLTSLRSEDGVGIVRVEDVFATDADDLWLAITDPSRLARWIAEVHGDLRLGGEFRARFTSSWVGTGTVDVCERPNRLLVAMAAGPDDTTVIEAVLTPVAGGTRLVVEERGIPERELPGHGAGWQVHLEDLAVHLAGGEPQDWRPRWQARLPEFQGRGPAGA